MLAALGCRSTGEVEAGRLHDIPLPLLIQ